jgi:acyl-CoA reductase-like NAD-dependent aldehyde dehydrogenase
VIERNLLLDGAWVEGPSRAEVRSPWGGEVVARVAQASTAHADRALRAARAALPRLRALSARQRREVLFGVARGLERRGAEIVEAIVREAGKPRAAARVELARAVETFTLAASELARYGGEIVPVDLAAGAEGTSCEVRRFAAGVVVGIVPFNFPLNLGAHKVAPALAVGAPIIVKPPPQAPSAQIMLAEIALEAGADPAALQVLPCDNSVAEALATDPRVRVLSFTGSARVGWRLKASARGRVVLELGGNAGAIVCADADLDAAAARLAAGAFVYAGQVCIKAQRLVVEAPAYDAFVEKFVQKVKGLAVGDPGRDDVVVGPVIDDASAERIEAWVREALGRGAKALCGGTREGRLVAPTVLEGVPRDAKAYGEEIFGPVALVERAADFDAALEAVNAGEYGLQAGLFTNDLRKVRRAFDALDVGGVIVNDAPSFRSDNMPYGGNKGSGLGREGVRYAMHELSDERVLVLRP